MISWIHGIHKILTRKCDRIDLLDQNYQHMLHVTSMIVWILDLYYQPVLYVTSIIVWIHALYMVIWIHRIHTTNKILSYRSNRSILRIQLYSPSGSIRKTWYISISSRSSWWIRSTWTLLCGPMWQMYGAPERRISGVLRHRGVRASGFWDQPQNWDEPTRLGVQFKSNTDGN